MAPDPGIIQQAHDKTEQCYQLAEQALACRLPRPEIRFDQRGQAAGSACGGRNLIRFNPQILSARPEAFISQVVPHEVAHMVVWHCFTPKHRYSRKPRPRPHGPEWKMVMEQIFSVRAERTHTFAVAPSRRLQRYDYRCGCQLHQLTSIRHKRVLAGQRYLCRRCGEALIPVQP